MRSVGGEADTATVTSMQSSERNLMHRWVRRVGSTLKTSLAVVGFATIAGIYMEYKRLNPDECDETENKKKKRVLVIPFHRMQLVEQKELSVGGMISDFDRNDDSDTVTQFEVRELVDLLHHAATDPSITAIYGIFGHGGMGIEQAGWAQLEEVRNALQVIKESHRRHPEPNLTDQYLPAIPLLQSKPLFAYTDSFASFTSPSNKDYYLASVFSHIHLQEKGELNLFGMISQQFFLRGLLEKYGIQLHVFKHGHFKNAPNMFTHNTFDQFHFENVANIQKSINGDVCEEITRSRSKAFLTSKLTKKQRGDVDVARWKVIHEYGTLPAESAWKAGLVDFLPRRDPLLDLVDSNECNIDANETKKTKGEVVAKWKPHETDFKRFVADKAVTLKDYAKQVSVATKAAQRRQSWNDEVDKNPTLKRILSTIGFAERKDGGLNQKERIALLQVNGTIGDGMASNVVHAIRKIRDDDKTKCVVVRVTSPGGSILACETIKQELEALNLPVVFSFGNVSASGGYYIATSADRIFCSKKTITGSIGVFGIRMDLTGLAAKYGINVEHVATGDLSGSYMPFYPMSNKMKKNMAGQIDRYYAQFKKVVADGRNMPNDRVEVVAQGRVWTGDQAKSIGLADEIGGLHRAISYARRTYTSNEEDNLTDVVVWPKKKTLLEKLMSAREARDGARILALLFGFVTGQELVSNDSVVVSRQQKLVAEGMVDWIMQSPSGIPGTLSGVLMAADENAAIRCLLETRKQSSRASKICCQSRMGTSLD